jgi:hypothetical protein
LTARGHDELPVADLGAKLARFHDSFLELGEMDVQRRSGRSRRQGAVNFKDDLPVSAAHSPQVQNFSGVAIFEFQHAIPFSTIH